ncbi:uncharacterized protein LOC111870268 isoform X2 [Cryptotermes secundus]|nr:uncharacterized protein LOC111870268 isoform X2 [Cryptotermes secundus]XP_033609642.1 uncharacterized protein LOC111870268 isoform X2 [Cryptotermes secundus]XP_033609643.1 uncharacterized protein LOC111870268 isoform X2 [Cryptotermes secundus]
MIEEKKRREEGKRGAWNEVEIEIMKSSCVMRATVVRPQTSKRGRATDQMLKLDCTDDDGHVLNAKEAFRYLSHKFHRKGPGRNKVVKRMKKNEQEGVSIGPDLVMSCYL